MRDCAEVEGRDPPCITRTSQIWRECFFATVQSVKFNGPH